MQHFFKVMVFFLLLPLLGGCGVRGDDSSIIRIAMLKGPSAMGMVKFIDSLRNTTSPTIAVDIFTEPMQVRKELINSSTAFAALPMNIAAVLYNRELPYSLVAVPVSGSLYLAGTDSSVTNWKDLKGKRVNVMARGMTPDILFRYLLTQNGLTPDVDVLFDYNYPTHTDIASALASGRVALGVITEPYLSIVKNKTREVKSLLDLNEEWKNIRGTDIAETAFMVSDSLLLHSPELVQSVMNGYARSIDWVNSYPDSAAVLMVRYGIVSDVASALLSIEGTHLNFRKASEHRTEIDTYLRTLFEMSPEIIGGKLPDETFYK